MGLAASQCRLLFLTSRQNDLSAKMQRISMEKMRLASDEDELYNEYTRKKNVTNYELNGEAITYANVMGTNAANNGTLYLIQNATTNAVILNSSIANKFGLTGTGNGTDFVTKAGSKNDFINKMTGIEASEITTILQQDYTPPTAVSLSVVEFLNGNATAGAFIDPANSKVWGDGSDSLPSVGSGNFNSWINSNKGLGIGLNDSGGISGFWGTEESHRSGYEMWQKDSCRCGVASGAKSLSELYNNGCIEGGIESSMFLGTSAVTNGDTPPTSLPNHILSAFNSLTNAIGQSLVNGLKNAGLNEDKVKSLIQTENSSLANTYKTNLQGSNDFFKNYTKSDCQFAWDNNRFEYNENAMAAAMRACRLFSGIVTARSCCENANNTWSYAVDAGYYVKQLVDSVFNKLTGGECMETDMSGNQTVDKTKSCQIKTEYLTVQAPTPDQAKSNKVHFYSSMYDNICTFGYQVDGDADDSGKFNAKLQNGTYLISGEVASNSSALTAVQDKEAQEEAKTWYDNELSKIRHKEDQWDTQLNKVQTEYTAITNDYNSVKSIINANIEKSFTYCSNG